MHHWRSRLPDARAVALTATPRRLDRGAVKGHVRRMDHAAARAVEAKIAPFSPDYQAPNPDACRDMKDVRAGVDEIDRMLVTLMARRQGYMNAAARIKQSRGAVRDEARIQQVLDNVKTAAEDSGLSWAIAEPVWRTMMEQCIAHEFVVWDEIRA